MKKFLDIALHTAENSEHSFRHAAILVKDGKILSVAQNKYKGRCFSNENQNIIARHSIHAEENVLKQYGKKCEGATIYVARSASYGPANSKPCLRCQKILRYCGICKAIYTTTNGFETLFI